MRIVIGGILRSVVGGVETYLRALMPALIARGHEVSLLYERDAGDPRLHIDAGLDIARWQAKDDGSLPGDLARWRPDVLYAHCFASDKLEQALLSAMPAALFVHSYYGTCLSGLKCHAFPAVQMCERTLGPACLALHYLRRCGGLNPRTAAEDYLAQRGRQRRLPSWRALFVATRHMEQELLRHGVSSARVHRNPIPPYDAVAMDAPPAERAQTGTILFVGRLVKTKGCQYVIDALPLASSALGRPLRLLVAGSGPMQAELEALARRRGADVSFLSWIDSRARQAHMESADLLAVPSVWPEPYGMVGVEAACVGLPAVAFEVGGIPEWLEGGVSGELAPANPPTAEGLADAIVRALRDPAHHHRLRMGAWGVAKRITMEAHLERLETVLAQIV